MLQAFTILLLIGLYLFLCRERETAFQRNAENSAGLYVGAYMLLVHREADRRGITPAVDAKLACRRS